MQAIENVFRALADRTRLRILSLLCDGELCVGDLVKLLGVVQPMASRHLAYLRGADLVSTRREGAWAFYSLSKPKSKFDRQLLACVKACRAEQPELQADCENARSLRESGGCCPGGAKAVGKSCGTIGKQETQ